MLTESDIPEETKRLLQIIQQHDPSAAIVGGYLRDLAAGVKPKDVDIFITRAGLRSLLGSWQGMTPLVLEGYGGGAMRAEVAEVWEYSPLMPFPLPVQIIVLREPLPLSEVIHRVDFDFCRVGYGGTGKLLLGHGFEAAISTRTATYCGPDDPKQLARSARRVRRWETRFTGWRFLRPAGRWGEMRVAFHPEMTHP
ncbi:hypothetical protein NON00_02350 [Roseomonas sp. GC11]|uniref:hypothetical protein n=1 Tax=Roseomonas sp. GC11 TaxID=2950546 RepID=UPI00210DB5B4|nr:hypothetical protein [Roseomonas sp. GC11]MCQ4158768.1 hypothetical protein [Roseomonas sp. GC11]